MTGEPHRKKQGTDGIKAIGGLAERIIALSSSLIALSVAILAAAHEARLAGASLYLKLAWVALFVSCLFGILTIQAVIGRLRQLDAGSGKAEPRNLKLFGTIMLIAFLIGIVATAAIGWQLF